MLNFCKKVIKRPKPKEKSDLVMPNLRVFDSISDAINYVDEAHIYKKPVFTGEIFIEREGVLFNQIECERDLGERKIIKCFSDGRFDTMGDSINLSENASYLIISISPYEPDVCSDYRILYCSTNISRFSISRCVDILKYRGNYASTTI